MDRRDIEMELKIKFLRDGASLPVRASDGAAAYDIKALLDRDVTINPGCRELIPTGIAIELPDPGYAALLYSRSGSGIKHGVSLSNSVGVIDSDYRGEIRVGLINLGNSPFIVCNGDRIAQMMIVPIMLPEMKIADTLEDSSRGEGGFGSTGQ